MGIQLPSRGGYSPAAITVREKLMATIREIRNVATGQGTTLRAVRLGRVLIARTSGVVPICVSLYYRHLIINFVPGRLGVGIFYRARR